MLQKLAQGRDIVVLQEKTLYEWNETKELDLYKVFAFTKVKDYIFCFRKRNIKASKSDVEEKCTYLDLYT